MKITLFKNGKGLIHGDDPKRIACDKDGVLKIGTTEVNVSGTSIMPLLFHGVTGDYKATFASGDEVWELEKVAVRGGWIAPPPPTTVELMELRCRAETAEARVDLLEGKIRELGEIFDTNSLNFLIR
jgi:hypothetical protein